MEITWYGYSCFIIKTSNGKKVLMDPFYNNLEYDNNFPKCDLITISYNHFDISYLKSSNNETEIINKTGLTHIDSLEIEGLNSFHDKNNGLKRGPNIIYILKDSKYSLCHLGNLGHIPSSLVLEKLKNIDILLIPIGGHFTLNGFDAAKLCKLIKPKYIIPMHYRTNRTSLYLDDPKNFIISIKHLKKFNSNVLNSSYLDSSYESECILLTPPNN